MPQVPQQPGVAEIRAELVKEREQGARLQETLSNRTTSVQQVVAEAAANVQRAKASEQTAWQAQLASELKAGRADAAAEAAAMGLVERNTKVKKKEKIRAQSARPTERKPMETQEVPPPRQVSPARKERSP